MINYDQQLMKCCNYDQDIQRTSFQCVIHTEQHLTKVYLRKMLSIKHGTFKQKFGFDGDSDVIFGSDIT